MLVYAGFVVMCSRMQQLYLTLNHHIFNFKKKYMYVSRRLSNSVQSTMCYSAVYCASPWRFNWCWYHAMNWKINCHFYHANKDIIIVYIVYRLYMSGNKAINAHIPFSHQKHILARRYFNSITVWRNSHEFDNFWFVMIMLSMDTNMWHMYVLQMMI